MTTSLLRLLVLVLAFAVALVVGNVFGHAG